MSQIRCATKIVIVRHKSFYVRHLRILAVPKQFTNLQVDRFEVTFERDIMSYLNCPVHIAETLGAFFFSLSVSLALALI